MVVADHPQCLPSHNAPCFARPDLDDVLTPRANQSLPDDLKICDFGFPHSLTFLTKSERRGINKKIAHSTLPGAELPSYRWDVFELLTKGRKANGIGGERQMGSCLNILRFRFLRIVRVSNR